MLALLPIASISIILLVATSTFKDDKVTYIYNSVLSDAQAKSSSSSAQLNSFVRALQSVTFNYDPKLHKLSENGKKFIQSEKNLKNFYDYLWNGSQFTLKFNASVDSEYFEDEKQEIQSLLQSTLENKITVYPMESRPFHLIIAAKIGETNHINAIVIEVPEFYALFSKSGQGESFLYSKEYGHLVGGEEVQDVSKFLQDQVFAKEIFEMTTESIFSGEEALISISKTSVSDIYVVSMINKSEALAALRTLFKRSLLFSVALLSLFVMLGVWAANSLVNPLRSLTSATSKVMKGDFSVKVDSKNNDEVGLLASNFNKMTEEVARLMNKTAENARMEAELHTAKTVQDTLFPKSDASFGKIKLYGFSQPASECGGDWWYYCRSGSRIYLWIGDATGHGVPAALLTSAARAVASIIEEFPSFKPSEALKMLNRAIYSTSKGQMMMTFFVACIDLEEGVLTYSNASHDPPYYLSKGTRDKPKRKDFFPLMEANSYRLGERINTKFSDHEMPIELGDKLIFYTDGIFDVRSQKGDLWGERRFMKQLAGIHQGEARQTVEGVFKTIDEFREETPLDDDVTLVVLEYGKRSVA